MEGQTPPPPKDVDITASGPLGYARDVTLGPEATALTSDEVGVIKNDAEASGVISPTESDKRMTTEDAEKSKAEKETAMSKLMDEMEASVETQGQYFIRLGDKVPLTQTQQETRSRFLGLGKKTIDTEVESGVDDQRVLILNALENSRNVNVRSIEASMVTRDGIKIVRMEEISGKPGDFGQVYDIIGKLRGGSKPSGGTGLLVSKFGVKQIKLYINEAGNTAGTTLSVSDYSEATPFKGTPEEFQDTVRKSIDQTESPHKRVVEENTADAQLANSAAEMIRTLPPRP